MMLTEMREPQKEKMRVLALTHLSKVNGIVHNPHSDAAQVTPPTVCRCTCAKYKPTHRQRRRERQREMEKERDG